MLGGYKKISVWEHNILTEVITYKLWMSIKKDTQCYLKLLNKLKNKRALMRLWKSQEVNMFLKFVFPVLVDYFASIFVG